MATKRIKTDELEDVVEQIAVEEMRELTDVVVAEDGYIHDVPMLAGYIDPETGEVHNTFSYREMTGVDEEAINKSDIRANGARVTNTIIERCVNQIGTIKKKEVGTVKWGMLIKELYSGDLDYMSLKIREISKGTEVKFTHVCPECKAKLNTIVDTSEFGINPFNGEFSKRFTLPRGYKDKNGVVHTEGTMRLVNGLDRELIVPKLKKNQAEAKTILLTRLITFDGDVVLTNDNVRHMTLRDREYLEELLGEDVFGVDSSVEVICYNCGADLSDKVGESNFL